MTDTDVAKICGFMSARFFGIPGRNAFLHDLDWLTDKPCVKRDDSVLERLQAIANITPLEKQHNPQEPRRFLGSDYFMGLAPAEAKLGDRIFRFWGCDVAAVLREERGVGLRIIGRADVSTPWEEVEQQTKCIEPNGTFSSGGVAEIRLDIYALQRLTQ